MKATKVYVTSVGVVALLTLPVNVAGQTHASGILSALEVQQLVTRGEPGDHARLSEHFSTLAERYATEADSNEATSHAFAGNPNHQLVPAGSAHFKRLADISRKSADTLSQLTIHHQILAAGMTSAIPVGAVRFEAGAGAPVTRRKEVAAIGARASAPADHRGIEEYFLTLAKGYAADADRHVTMAQAYRGTRIAQAAAHCDRLVAIARDSAKEATTTAKLYKQLAALAR